jgi:hypothetical protein
LEVDNGATERANRDIAQLDLLRQRPGRPDGGGVAKLHRFLHTAGR